MSRNLFRLDETGQWLRYAREDWASAEVLLRASPPLVKPAMFHCQQAVEKALKALLVWHEKPFRKTHDLVTLGDQCISLDPTMEDAVSPAMELTRYAVKIRYPGDEDLPSIEEAKKWLAVAGSVLAAVAQRLPEEIDTSGNTQLPGRM